MITFKCADAEKLITLYFGTLNHFLCKEDFTYFIRLLALYLCNKTHDIGIGEGNAICGLMQGLVAEHPKTRLAELQLDKEHSKSFIRLAEYESVNQALKAGYSMPMAFENRGIIRDLLSDFFVANGFLKLDD